MEFSATCAFTPKEVALFAVSVGYGSSWQSYQHDLRYTWEKHKKFSTVPTFAFALLFWSIPKRDNDDEYESISTHNKNIPLLMPLPDLPPPVMKRMGLIPSHCLLSNDVELDEYPVLHTWQSITWHTLGKSNQLFKRKGLDGVACCNLKVRFLKVQPKSVGTFVTTATHVTEESSGMPIYTLQSTALIFGLDQDLVKPMNGHAIDSTPKIKYAYKKQKPFCEKDMQVTMNQALLYRLSSGDSNSIHVDASTLPPFVTQDQDDEHGVNKPILHGLAILAMAVRLLEQCICEQLRSEDLDFQYLEASFRKPVFLGEALRVRVWWVDPDQLNRTNLEERVIMFDVVKVKSKAIAVDCGCVKLTRTPNARL